MSRFRFLTAGESHGRALVVIVEGIPSGLSVSQDDLSQDLARRQKGYGRGARMAIECDRVDVVSGIRHGQTIGSPIALLIWNKDWENWQEEMSVEPGSSKNPVTVPRPGHADLAGALKYSHRDIRNVLERASARETAARTAAGAVARRFLGEFGIRVVSHVLQIGTVKAKDIPRDPGEVRRAADASEVRCADSKAAESMISAIDQARSKGDTLGGVIEVVATGVPPGLGSHIQWDTRIDGRIAQVVMSIPGIKGVEIGLGFEAARYPGSQVHDEIFYDGKFTRRTNHAGGIEGGITNGEAIIVRAAMKPIPTLRNPLGSADILTGKAHSAHGERSDVCAVPAASVVAEAMVSITLCEAFLDKFGGDSLEETRRNFSGYIQSLKLYASDCKEGKS